MRKLLLILIGVILITGCSPKEESNKIKVVSTIFPYYDFTRAIAGDNVDLTMLINPGTDIHSYDPTPLDIAKITEADIFIYTGGHSDEWVKEIIGEIDNTKTKVIRVMDYLDVVIEEEIEGSTKEAEEEVEYDEHVWTSLENAKKIVEVIANELIKIDDINKNIYDINSVLYINEINRLDSDIKEIVDASSSKTLLFGDRFAFRYFTDQYGLNYSAAFPGCSSETEPSVSTITYLIKKIKEENIPVVLYLEMSSGKVADTLIEETDAKKMQMNSLQTISKADFKNGETYITLMEKNIEVLREVLK